MEILSAENIVKRYQTGDIVYTAVNGIDLCIEDGEFIGIMGPSGSGKTTLLNILSGIDKPSEGIIQISGTRIDDLDSDTLSLFRRQKLGFVFQDYNLLDNLTIMENIILPLTLEKKPEKTIRIKVNEIMRLLGISDISNKYPFQVSGGQQQRTAICRAMANDPVIIFADEPTGNLDSNTSGVIMNYFTKINSEKHATILMVTHDAYAASYCHRIVFIKDGRIYSEMVRECSRKEFYDKLINRLSCIGDDVNDIQLSRS